MSLEALQSAFAAALSDPAAVHALMPDLVHRDGRNGERVALYRGNLVAAWQKALTNAFPVVKALVGEEFFDALARIYGHDFPSDSGDLNRFGARLPDFLSGFEPAQSLPYLPDVARLEWLAHRAHYAADAAPVSRPRIASLLPHELLASRFALHPACSWLRSELPIATTWLAHQPDAGVDLPDTLDREEIALVVRPCWRVAIVHSTRAEIAALASLRAGEPLEAAIGAALDADASFDMAAALVRWLDLGVLATIVVR
jgi:hypothetical protein